MPTYRIQNSLQDISGLPRDEYVTSLYVAFPAPPLDADLLSLEHGIKNAYDTSGLEPYLSPGIAQGGHTTKIYRVGAPLGSPPVHQATWGFTTNPGSGEKAMPGEVACCLTFHGDPVPSVPNGVSGVHRQSWRGRIYMGPLSTKGMGAESPGVGRPTELLRLTVLAWANVWGQAVRTTTGKWVILSKKQGLVYPVARTSCDDAWDTQRSRGVRPSIVTAGNADFGGGPPGPIG